MATKKKALTQKQKEQAKKERLALAKKLKPVMVRHKKSTRRKYDRRQLKDDLQYHMNKLSNAKLDLLLGTALHLDLYKDSLKKIRKCLANRYKEPRKFKPTAWTKFVKANLKNVTGPTLGARMKKLSKMYSGQQKKKRRIVMEDDE